MQLSYCYSHLPFFFLNYRQFSASFYFSTHRVCLFNAVSCHNVTGHPDATFGCKLYKTKTRMFDSTGFTCLTLSRNTCATLEAFQMVPCGWDVILQGNSHDISTVGWCKAWFSIILNSLPDWLIWCCDVSLLSPMRPLGEVDREETGGAVGCLNRDKQFDRPEKKLPNQPPFNITVLLLYIASISSLHPRQ